MIPHQQMCGWSASIIDSLRNHNESAVFVGILAGGKGDQLVAVLCGDTRIVEGFCFAFGDVCVELFRGFCVRELIVSELACGTCVNDGFENCDDLVGLLFVKGIKTEGFVIFPEALVPELFEVREHGAVFLMMTINNQVI